MPDTRPPSPSQLKRIIDEDLSAEARADIAKAIVRCYKAADACCAGMREATRRDTIAHVRRGLMETSFAEVLSDAGGEVADVANASDTSNFVRVTVGRLLITQHAVNDMGELPREAHYRSTIARSAQVSMFEKDEQAPPPQAKLYCQVLYGCRNGSFPSFANITVPNETCSDVVMRVSLAEELLAARLGNDVVSGDGKLVAQEEVISDEVILSIKSTAPVVVPDPTDDLDSAKPVASEHVVDHVQLSLFDWILRKKEKDVQE